MLNLVLLVSLAIAPPVSSASAIPSESVRNAIAMGDRKGAGTQLNQLVESRLPVKAGKPDPLLDSIFADFYATSGEVSRAGPLFERLAANPATPNRSHYQLLLATYKETWGDLDGAAADYRSLSGTSGDAHVRRSALIGLARLTMTSDPAAALAILGGPGLAEMPPEESWERELLRSRAYAIAGQNASVGGALDKAWQSSPSAPLTADAIVRVANDRALLAARTGDRSAMVPMLAVGHQQRGGNDREGALAKALPTCGTAGVMPADRVVVEVSRIPQADRPTMQVAWANRAGVGAIFLKALAAAYIPTVGDAQASEFALACRTVPSPDRPVRTLGDNRQLSWLSANGVYLNGAWDDATDPNTLAARLAAREARYGPNSMFVLPTLLLMASNAEYAADTDGRKQAAVTVARVLAIGEANGAPPGWLLQLRIGAISAKAANQTITFGEAETLVKNVIDAAIADPAVPSDELYELTIKMTKIPIFTNAVKVIWLEELRDRLKREGLMSEAAATALALRQIHLEMLDPHGADAATTGFPISNHACALSETKSQIVSSGIKPEDYPKDLVNAVLQGISVVEFDVGSDGVASGGRLIVSDPPLAFDAATLARVPTIRYEPARFNGVSAACVAEVQSVRWQVPYM